jgi:microcin C transport system permease protein
VRLSPITRRRLAIFRAHRRGFWSLWIFLTLFCLSLFAEFIANDRPLLVRFAGHWYVPVVHDYPEDTYSDEFMPTTADYTDPDVAAAINKQGWMIWPVLPYSYNTNVKNLPVPAPAPPSWKNPLGTDDEARDVLARVIYGFRLSVLFGFTLTVIASAVGIAAGAIQGYRGGLVDLLFQRFIEIWSGMPQLYLLIILGSIIAPSFWILLTFLPFTLSGSVSILASLDFLGFGLPPGSPSLGELVSQGKDNLQAPWLGITAFLVLGGLLTLLIFVGEAVRDAFDPRKGPR